MISKYLVWPLLGLSFSFVNPCTPQSKGPKTAKIPDKVFEVSVVHPEFSTVAQDYAVDGQFDASEVSVVTANSIGEISEVLVNEGDAVTKDDPLVVLSNTTLLELIDLKRARAKEFTTRLKETQTRLTRNYGEDIPATVEDTLFLDEEPVDEMQQQKDYGTATPTQNKPASLKVLAEVLETTADSLNKQADALDRKLLELSHTSPVSGVVTKVHVTPGNGVREQDKLIEISQMDPMSVTFLLPDEVASFIDKHSVVKVSPVDAPEVVGEGTVYFISPNIDPANGKIEVRAHVSNPDLRIKGGQKATIKVATRKMDRVIVLPKQVLYFENGKTYVFIVFKDQAKLVEVEASSPDEKGQVQIAGDLKVDDAIIINRPMDLVHNSYVKVQVDAAK